MISRCQLKRFLLLEKRYQTARDEAEKLKALWEIENIRIWNSLSLAERNLILTGDMTYEDFALL
jgi:hypothetical protein